MKVRLLRPALAAFTTRIFAGSKYAAKGVPQPTRCFAPSAGSPVTLAVESPTMNNEGSAESGLGWGALCAVAIWGIKTRNDNTNAQAKQQLLFEITPTS